MTASCEPGRNTPERARDPPSCQPPRAPRAVADVKRHLVDDYIRGRAAIASLTRSAGYS